MNVSTNLSIRKNEKNSDLSSIFFGHTRDEKRKQEEVSKNLRRYQIE